ncbi:hypothetical protein [Streptomyces sp. NPDC017086]|uniref:hypothetical protein n=1 Tax=Streptomyces sp. NPDC017086 TaxID=3364976 RepID=UPI0037B82AD3
MSSRESERQPEHQRIAEARKGAGVFVRDFRPVRRRGIERLAREGWDEGRSVWSTDIGDRELDAQGLAVEVNEMVLDASAYVLEYDFEA